MWVLLEQTLSTPDKPLYFKGRSDYTPTTTGDVREAIPFDSKEAAKLSQAYRYRNSNFVPVEVEIVVVKSKAA